MANSGHRLCPCIIIGIWPKAELTLHNYHSSADKHKDRILAFIIHNPDSCDGKHENLNAFNLNKDEKKSLSNRYWIKDHSKVIINFYWQAHF